MSKLSFLSSTRFWGLIIMAIVRVLEGEMILSSDLATAIYTIVGGYIGIRTIDKTAKAVGGIE